MYLVASVAEAGPAATLVTVEMVVAAAVAVATIDFLVVIFSQWAHVSQGSHYYFPTKFQDFFRKFSRWKYIFPGQIASLIH